MVILNVTTDSKTFEVSYNNISEHVLAQELNLQPTTFPAVSQDQEVIALQNEMKILNHFSNLGFTHINDPQSSLKPYPIDDHIYYIKQHLSNYTKHVQTSQTFI